MSFIWVTRTTCWILLIFFFLSFIASPLGPTHLPAQDRLEKVARRAVKLLALHPDGRSAPLRSAGDACYRAASMPGERGSTVSCAALEFLICHATLDDCRRGADYNHSWATYRRRAAKAAAAEGLVVTRADFESLELAALQAYRRVLGTLREIVLPGAPAAGGSYFGIDEVSDVRSVATRFGVVEEISRMSTEDEDYRHRFSVLRFRGRVVFSSDDPEDLPTHLIAHSISHVVHLGEIDVVLGTEYGDGFGWCIQATNFLLAVSKRGIVLYENFGCIDAFTPEINRGRLRILFPEVVPEVGEAKRFLVFDGRNTHEEIVYEREDGATLSGARGDVMRWIGRNPNDIFVDPGERLRFMRVMTRKELGQVRMRLAQLNDPVVRMGSVVCGRGQLLSWGSTSFGIEIATGRAFARYDVDGGDRPYLLGVKDSERSSDVRRCLGL